MKSEQLKTDKWPREKRISLVKIKAPDSPEKDLLRQKSELIERMTSNPQAVAITENEETKEPQQIRKSPLRCKPALLQQHSQMVDGELA